MRKRAKRQRLAVAILLQLAVWGSFGQVEALTTSQIDYNGKNMGFDQNDGQFGWTAGAPFPGLTMLRIKNPSISQRCV